LAHRPAIAQRARAYRHHGNASHLGAGLPLNLEQNRRSPHFPMLSQDQVNIADSFTRTRSQTIGEITGLEL
jgi:hypothetical protein